MKRFLFFIVVISSGFISCNQSGEENANTTTTPTSNATENPLSIPANPTATTATTIYDIWVLDSINQKAPDPKYFSHGTPYFDFNAEKNTVNGHTGCNSISGIIKVQDQRLTFDSLVISSQNCSSNEKGFERRLLAGFRSGKTTYKIGNEKLYLKIDASNEYIFRKIRRN